MYIFFTLCCLLLHSSLYSLVAGSQEAVSVQSHIEFPAADTDNEMLGFGWFKNGFALEDASTTCTFNSVFPVSGTVNMRGGTLALKTDLHFANILDVTGFGSILGQSYALHFPSNLITLPSNSDTIEDTTIILSNDIKFTSTLSFKGTTTIKGGGHTIFLGDNGGIQLLDDAHLIFEDVDIKNVAHGNIALSNDAAHITFDDTNLYFDANLTFSTGSFLIKDNVNFFGSQKFIYDSARTSTIESFATWQIHDDMEFNIGKKTSASDPTPLHFQDRSSVLHLSNCHLRILEHGFDLLNGTVVYDAQVTLDTVGTTTDTGLIIGNGSADDDPLIRFDSGASVRLDSSEFTFNTGAPNVIETGAHKNARLSRNIGSNIFVKHDLMIPSMKVEMLSEMIPPMVIADGKTVEYIDTLVELPNAEFDITSGRQGQLTYLLRGNDSIFFSRGTLPLNLDIENSGNRVMGNGNFTGTITFADANATLISEIDGEFDNTIIMGGGTLQLDDDLRLGVNIALTGSGTIDLQEFSMHLPPVDLSLSSSINWQGQNAAINLNSAITLSTTSTMSGTVTINGNGNVLKLADTGALEIAADSTLILKNLRLDGVKDTNVHMLDETSKLILDDTLWLQADDYTFDNGSFTIIHDVNVVGQKRFVYDSSRTSTISGFSMLTFSDTSALSIGKKSGMTQEPLYFENSSSTLALDDAALHVTNDGWVVTRGKLAFNHIVQMDIDSTSTADGLTFGSNTVGEDATIQLDANATWNFNTGHMAYNNADPNSFVTSGNLSARLKRSDATKWTALTDLNLSNFIFETETQNVKPIEIASGKIVTINNFKARLGNAEFILNNVKQNSSLLTLMDGDTSILVEQSSALPFPILISGANNTFRGSGAVGAPLTLQDSNTEVSFDLQGELQSSIQLNGGTISIDSDLDFGPDATITGSGTINVGSQKVTLGATDFDFTATTKFVSNGGILELNAGVSLSSTTTISGTLLIDGNGNTFTFKDGARVVIEPDSKVIYRNLRLENLEEKHITCQGPTSQLQVDDSIIILGDDLSLNEGSVSFINQVDVVGSHTFSYDSAQTSTVEKNSVLHISDNVLLKVGKTKDGVDEPFHFADNTATLELDNCSFLITSSGMQFSTGTIRVDREVDIDVNSTSTANGLTLGSGQSGDTLMFELSPGATVRFSSGHTTYNVPSPNAIVSLSPTARFVRANASTLHANFSIAFKQMTLEHSANSTTTLASGATLSHDDTTFIIPGTEFNFSGVQTNPLAVTLAGDGDLFLTKGAMPLATVVSGTGNTVLGNGNLSGPLTLANGSARVQWALNGGLAGALSLNGGQITLAQDMLLSRGVTAASAGTINLDDSRFVLGSQEVQWPTDMLFKGSDGEVTMNNDLHLNATWTFTGKCVFNGNGNTLFLGDDGQIDVANTATLTMKNMRIRDIAGDNIRCLDDAGTIILDSILWLQDDLFTFSHGALQWKNQVTMSGTHTFAYQTTQTSTVLRQSKLLLENGFTFTYDPIGSSVQDLIAFENQTAKLQLANATLATGLDGMQLKGGTFEITGDSNLQADVVEENENIIQRGLFSIGGATKATEMKVEIGIGTILRLVRGGIIYQNKEISSMVMNNELSTISLQAQTLLDLQETLDVDIGRLEMSNDALLTFASGKELIGSIFELEPA